MGACPDSLGAFTHFGGEFDISLSVKSTLLRRPDLCFIERSGELQMRTILLVEDDTRLRRAASDALKGAGYHVLEAREGDHARDLLEMVRPSLLLLDLDCFGGTELSHWVALQQQLEGMRVVLMSAFELRALPPHTAGALRKPFRLEELLAVLKPLD